MKRRSIMLVRIARRKGQPHAILFLSHLLSYLQKEGGGGGKKRKRGADCSGPAASRFDGVGGTGNIVLFP